MKICKIVLLFLSLLMFSREGYAELSDSCKGELRQLVVPPLKGVVMKKNDIQAEIDDVSDGVYSVRLFVPSDSPDNLDKQVSIGWVNLDVNSMKAYNVTNDPDNHVELGVNRKQYKHFVEKCLSGG